MSKWYATIRDGKEVLSGKEFAALIAGLFIGVPLLTFVLLVYVYKSRTWASLYEEFKVGGVGFLIAVGVVAVLIARTYFQLHKQSVSPDPSLTSTMLPTDSESTR